MKKRTMKQTDKAARRAQEAALCRQIGSIVADCCHLLDRANAALKMASEPRPNRDAEIRRQTLEELFLRYGIKH